MPLEAPPFELLVLLPSEPIEEVTPRLAVLEPGAPPTPALVLEPAAPPAWVLDPVVARGELLVLGALVPLDSPWLPAPPMLVNPLLSPQPSTAGLRARPPSSTPAHGRLRSKRALDARAAPIECLLSDRLPVDEILTVPGEDRGGHLAPRASRKKLAWRAPKDAVERAMTLGIAPEASGKRSDLELHPLVRELDDAQEPQASAKLCERQTHVPTEMSAELAGITASDLGDLGTFQGWPFAQRHQSAPCQRVHMGQRHASGMGLTPKVAHLSLDHHRVSLFDRSRTKLLEPVACRLGQVHASGGSVGGLNGVAENAIRKGGGEANHVHIEVVGRFEQEMVLARRPPEEIARGYHDRRLTNLKGRAPAEHQV
jgi:hypothetical protein